MKKDPLVYLKSRENLRLKKLSSLKQNLSQQDYLKNQSIFSNDYLFFSSYEFFMNKELQQKTGHFFVEEWLIYFMIDKTIQKWLINHSVLDSIHILIPYCGSGSFTQLIIEYLFIQFKKINPFESSKNILNQIIEKNIKCLDTQQDALNISKKRILTLFDKELTIEQKMIFSETSKFDVIMGTLPRGDLLSDELKQEISSPHNCTSLDFIDWSLKLLKDDGEICFIVPEKLSNHVDFSYWRKQQAHHLNLHSVTSIPYSTTHGFESLVMGFNQQKNYLIERSSFIDLYENQYISTEEFYDKNNHYIMKK